MTTNREPGVRLRILAVRTLALCAVIFTLASIGCVLAAIWTTGPFWPARLCGTAGICGALAFAAGAAATGVAL